MTTKRTPADKLTSQGPKPSHEQQPKRPPSWHSKIISLVWRIVSWPFRVLYRYLLKGFAFPVLGFMAMAVTWITTLGATAGLVVVGLYLTIAAGVPEPQATYRFQADTSSKVSYSTGEQAFRIAREYRIFVPYEDFPPMLVQGFLAAEDQRFFEHKGVDGLSLTRAMLQNLRNINSDARAVGASTITQQVAKARVGSARTIDRKLREAIYAAKMEQNLTKEQIIEIYLNEVFFGVNTYGVAAATERYFGKTVDQLKISEIAFLASLPKGPVNYHPIRRPEAAKTRRDWVIDRMAAINAITQIDADAAKLDPLPQAIYYGLKGAPKSYFDIEAQAELVRRFGNEVAYKGGLDVLSTVDPQLQGLAEFALQKHLLELDGANGFRGPFAKLQLENDDWFDKFLDMHHPAMFVDWQIALVVNVRQEAAHIVLKNGGQGQITLWDMNWAGDLDTTASWSKLPANASQVLKVGDVVVVEKGNKANSRTLKSQSDFLTYVSNAKRNFSSDLPRYKLRQLPKVSGAVVAMDPKTGEIKAMVGGFSPQISKFNRASQSLRQPGSTVKPFITLAAIEQGYKASSMIEDKEKEHILKGGEKWTPKNYDGKFLKKVSLEMSTIYSRNVPFVNLYFDLGKYRISNIMKRFKLYDETHINPSVVLGANETSLMKLVAAYGAVANQGIYNEPTTLRTVSDKEGLTLFSSQGGDIDGCKTYAFCNSNKIERVSQPYATRQLRKILQKTMAFGTGQKIQKMLPEGALIMGKTGTTNGSKDTWFIAFDNDLVIGVYVGFDNPETLGGKATGGGLAGPIFADIYNGKLTIERGEADLAGIVERYNASAHFDAAARIRGPLIEPKKEEDEETTVYTPGSATNVTRRSEAPSSGQGFAIY